NPGARSGVHLLLAWPCHRLARPAPHRIEIEFPQSHHLARAGHHLGAARRRPHIRRITMKKRTLLSALAVTSVLALSACGGGGGNPLEGGGDNSGASGSPALG